MNNKVELMSPAGTWQALEAAVNAGADAVYLGGSRFGARQYADNFDREELARAVDFAHLRRVKIYVTVNTLVADSEMPDVADYLQFLSCIGVDAAIVQDMGIAALARELVPELPLFASTQMTVANAAGVTFAEKMGFSRSVLAREASLDEIKDICRQAKSEIEVFVHGALCMCYSGQCLMSSLIGGRSGNRGQCAQPCRLPYSLVDENGAGLLDQGSAGKYILSPKDLNTLEMLPELIEAGVTSFKIEGRMKRPEYVAVVTSIYRQAIDSCLGGDFKLPENALRDLRQIFNRDFTTAYLKERPGRTILSDRRPNNRGVYIGRISFCERGLAYIKLEEDITTGDGLEVWVSVGGRAGVTAESIFLAGQPVAGAAAGQVVGIKLPAGASAGDRVFRIADIALLEKAQSFFGPGNKRLIPVSATVSAQVGQPLKIVFTDDEGNQGEAETAFICEAARKHPLTVGGVQKQVERLGSTDFYLVNISCDFPENIMAPVSEINEARRAAIEQLKERRLVKYFPLRSKGGKAFSLIGRRPGALSSRTLLSVHADSLDKAEAAALAGADILIFGGETYSHKELSIDECRKAADIARHFGKQIYFATPRIVSEAGSRELQERLSLLAGLKPDGFLVGSLSVWQLAGRLNVPLRADWPLNAFNSWSLDFWRKKGANGVALSLELTMQQVEELAAQNLLPVECVVHGRMEMMVSEYCAPGSLLGEAACQSGKYFLEDRKGEHFPIVTDQFCRMHILNAKELCLLDSVERFQKAGVERIRIDGRYMDVAGLRTATDDYRAALDGRAVSSSKYSGITRGHYFRGVV